MNFNECKNILIEASNLSNKIPIKEKTFMDISGYPHYENVCSNILAFYFNPTEEHKLSGLVVGSLIKVLENKNIKIQLKTSVDELKIYREYSTLKGNRIDLVLQNESFVIGIENKIDAWVYNDLEDYADTLNNISRKSIKILLSLHSNNETIRNTEFINITYQEFFNQLKADLNIFKGEKNKWFIYLQEFIKSLENFEGDMVMEEEIIKWMQDNKKEIDDFNKIKDIANKSILKKQKELKKIIYDKLKLNYIKLWISDLDTSCYIDSPLKYHADAKLTPDGWSIGFFTWLTSKENKVKQILVNSKYSIIKEERKHVWLFKFDYNTSLEQISEKLIEVYNYMENELSK